MRLHSQTIFKLDYSWAIHWGPKLSRRKELRGQILKKKFFSKNFFEKKNSKKIFEKKIEKILCSEKIFYFQRFLKIVFWKIKSLKIDRWQLGFDYFLTNFKGL